MIKFLIAFTLAILTVTQVYASAASTTATVKCVPFKVWDGDTFDAKCGKTQEIVRVRLHQADAPERNQPWGTQSRIWLNDRVLNKPQRVVIVTTEPGTKLYSKRVVARVYEPRKSVSVNRWSVRAGMSWVSPGYTPKTESIWRDYATAKTSKEGLWATVDPIPPWGWRHGQRHPRLAPIVPVSMMHEPVDFLQVSK